MPKLVLVQQELDNMALAFGYEFNQRIEQEVRKLCPDATADDVLGYMYRIYKVILKPYNMNVSSPF